MTTSPAFFFRLSGNADPLIAVDTLAARKIFDLQYFISAPHLEFYTAIFVVSQCTEVDFIEDLIAVP